MKRVALISLVLLAVLGAGCGKSPSQSAAAPETPQQTAPPTPPANIPPPTPVKPLGKLPTEAELSKLSDEDRTSALDAYLQQNGSVSAPAAAIQTPEGETRKSGSFQDAHYKVSGSVKILVKGDVATLVLSDDFKTEAGPNLHIIVSSASDAKTMDGLLQGKYADLGPLQGTSGVQSYPLGGMKSANVNRVAVYSKPFGVVFGVADMK